MADNMNGSIMEEDNSFGGRVKKAAKRVDNFWRGVADFINPNVAREGFTPSNIARDVNMWVEPVSQMALDEAQGRAEYPAWAFGLGAVPVLGKGAPYIAKAAGKATELTKPLMTALEKLGKGEGKIGGRNAEQVVKEYNANDRVYWELVNKRNELQNKVNAGNANEAEKKALADLEKQTDAALYQLNEAAKTFSDNEWLRNFDKEHVRGEDGVVRDSKGRTVMKKDKDGTSYKYEYPDENHPYTKEIVTYDDGSVFEHYLDRDGRIIPDSFMNNKNVFGNYETYKITATNPKTGETVVREIPGTVDAQNIYYGFKDNGWNANVEGLKTARELQVPGDFVDAEQNLVPAKDFVWKHPNGEIMTVRARDLDEATELINKEVEKIGGVPHTAEISDGSRGRYFVYANPTEDGYVLSGSRGKNDKYFDNLEEAQAYMNGFPKYDYERGLMDEYKSLKAPTMKKVQPATKPTSLLADTPAGSYNVEFVPGEGSIMEGLKK